MAKRTFLDFEQPIAELETKTGRLPFAAGKEVVQALWLKAPVQGVEADRVVTPGQVLEVLR